MSTVLESLNFLPKFSANLLQITFKLGGVEHLVYKPLQYRIHVALKKLIQERGEARIVVVKPRQVRSSTYFLSLIFQQMYEHPGTQALITAHRAVVTDELFATVKRFQEKLPDEIRLPSKKDNEETLYLNNESKCKVATAGSDAARGFPCRILQLSELGRCTGRQVKDLQEGALQTLANGPGSIGIAESTSGGHGNYFHELAKLGRDPKERWKTLFFSCYEEPEYQLEPPKNWEPDDSERELQKHFNLTLSQLYWRRDKLTSEFSGNVTAFNREYPATFEMAFEAAGGKLIDYMAVLKARKSKLERNPLSPVIMGVDPAGKGDRTVIVFRQGNVIFKHLIWRTMDDAQLTGIVNRLLGEYAVGTCFIDMGYGHGVVSHLRDLGRYNVIGVHFGAKATQPHLYKNKRTEMAAALKDWVHQGPDEQGGLVSIPDDDEFSDDLLAIPELQYSGSKGVFYLPAKEEIKEELGGKSTDIFDACCLTFAFPVKSNRQAELILPYDRPKSLLQTENTFAQLQGQSQTDIINPNFKYYTYGSRSDV